METLECVIADDEKLARDVLVNYAKRLDWLRVIGICGNTKDVRALLADHKPDILFLDIRMPMESGLALISTLENPPHIIFTTAYSEYAVTAFELKAQDYLLKPFSFERFRQAVERVREIVRVNGLSPSYIDVRVDRKITRVMVGRIRYIQAIGNYAKFYLDDGVILTYSSIQKLNALLSQADFRQIHKSYLVNMKRVTRYTATSLTIDSDTLPVGRRFKASLAQIHRTPQNPGSD